MQISPTNKTLFGFKFLLAAFASLLISTYCPAQAKTTSDDSKSTGKIFYHGGTTITVGGNTTHTVGKLPAVGTRIKNLNLTGADLKEKSLSDFKGKYIIMNIFPSVNTGVCSKSVRKFNEEAAALKNATVLCISKDLPFAQKAFCGAEGINNVVMLSDFRNNFGTTYGVEIADGPMRGLLSRAVIVVDPQDKIVYEQQVPEIGQEPDYASAIAAVK
jgi:thioredoxin-dependent peroxiredoxin